MAQDFPEHAPFLVILTWPERPLLHRAREILPEQFPPAFIIQPLYTENFGQQSERLRIARERAGHAFTPWRNRDPLWGEHNLRGATKPAAVRGNDPEARALAGPRHWLLLSVMFGKRQHPLCRCWIDGGDFGKPVRSACPGQALFFSLAKRKSSWDEFAKLNKPLRSLSTSASSRFGRSPVRQVGCTQRTRASTGANSFHCLCKSASSKGGRFSSPDGRGVPWASGMITAARILAQSASTNGAASSSLSSN